MKCLYGLPKSGKLWYEHYTRNLIKEAYAQSQYDPCLFYRINEHETTYICLFVDDTFVFSNTEVNLNTFFENMKKYYQVSLDTTAESFLGIHFDHLTDGSVLMSQPKLLQKVLKEYPQLPGYKSKKHSTFSWMIRGTLCKGATLRTRKISSNTRTSTISMQKPT